jgi:hypothetical protein
MGFLDDLTGIVVGPLDLASGIVNGAKDGASFVGHVVDGKWSDALDDGRKLMGDAGDVGSGLASLGFNVGGVPSAFEGSKSLSAESKVIQAALWAIGGMKLTTGTGTPCNGDEFRKSSSHIDELVKTLIGATPHSDRWDGTASQVYTVVNDEHLQLAGDVGDADLKVAVVLDEEADHVTSTRNTLDEVSKSLSDWDTATAWMNLCGPPGREAKLAADLATVASALPVCSFSMDALLGNSIANSTKIRDQLDQYATATKDTTGDPSSCDIFPNFDQDKLPDLGPRHPERLPSPDTPVQSLTRTLPNAPYVPPTTPEEPPPTIPATPYGAPATPAPR